MPDSLFSSALWKVAIAGIVDIFQSSQDWKRDDEMEGGGHIFNILYILKYANPKITGKLYRMHYTRAYLLPIQEVGGIRLDRRRDVRYRHLR